MNLIKNVKSRTSNQFLNNQKDYILIDSSCKIKNIFIIEVASITKKSILLFNILFYLSFLLLK